MDEKEKTNDEIPESPFEAEKGKMNQTPPPSYDKNEQWVQEYMEQFGEEPSFF